MAWNRWVERWFQFRPVFFSFFKNSEQSVHFRISFQNHSSANTTSDILSWLSEPLEAMNQLMRPKAYLLRDSWLPSGPPISMAAVKPSAGLFNLKFVRWYLVGFLCFLYQQNLRLPSFSVHPKHRFLGPTATTIHWVRERIRDSAQMVSSGYHWVPGPGARHALRPTEQDCKIRGGF